MPRKLLIVDDNTINRQILCQTLSEDYALLEAADGKEALALLEKHYQTLSAVLTDIVMPEIDGYALLTRIRDSVLFAQIPVIMVTGSEDEDSRLKALSLGANDFIVTPYNPEIVRHCVKNNIALRETASTLNAIQKDKLTGLFNREAFFEKVDTYIKGGEPGDYLLSCFDIDNFKLVNDQYGAVAGDQLLREIGRMLAPRLARIGGVGGRVSGDNFAVLLPASRGDLSIFNLIRENTDRFEGKPSFALSVGRYVINDLSLPASAIYDRAYIAKQSVKGRYDEHVAYFDNAMLDKLVRAQQISADMDAAVSEHQFEVWFQPQHNHATGALVGAEALARWRHPEKGLIPPGEFIPIFEQNGFVYELDKYVWTETCRHLRAWIDKGLNPLPVSVNISRYDVFREDFIDVLSGLIERFRIPTSLLRLEITESAFSKSTKIIVGVVKQLIDLGFTVEIDDFGSGYSSLNTLKNVPAQVVKLDMRFLEEDDDSQRGGNILESIVRMTKWLGMSVIAEGVEEKAQADYLASVGCSYIQGYLYARPMPADQYEAYCLGPRKEISLRSMDTVANLDNNAFWDPKSMDTLIFNSYVGGACIFEYHKGGVELLRATEKYAQMIGGANMTVEGALKLDWADHLDAENRARMRRDLDQSIATRKEIIGEYVFLDLPGCPHETYLRSTLRVVASTEDRHLVYCTNENLTAQREAERLERITQRQVQAAAAQIQSMMNDMPGGFVRMILEADGRVRPVYINEGFVKLIGLSREELTRLYDGDVFAGVHPDDLDGVRVIYAQMLSGSEAQSARYRLRGKNEGYIWLAVSGRRTSGFSGETYLNLYFSDASEQVRKEEAEHKLLDNLPCGAGVYEFKDGQMALTYQNKSYWQMVGLGDAAFPDPTPMSAIHPDDIPVIMGELSDAIGRNRDVACDIRLRHLTRGYREVHLAGRVLREETGAFLIFATFTPLDGPINL